MGLGHSHDRAAAERGRGHKAPRRRLAIAFGIAVVVLVLEVVGGVLSGSVALLALADAAHVAGDAAGVGLALFAATMAARPATALRSFGWQRLEILAAALNAALLLAVTGWILFEAVRRLSEPGDVEPIPMLVVAVIGMAANGVSLLVLAGADRDNLNVRGACLEVLADLLGSAAVVIAAIVIATTGFTRADAVVAVLIAVAVVPRAAPAARGRRRAARGDAEGHRPGPRARAPAGRPGCSGHARPARLDDHVGAASAVGARRGRRVSARSRQPARARPARAVPGRTLRCGALHASARIHRPRRPRKMHCAPAIAGIGATSEAGDRR